MSKREKGESIVSHTTLEQARILFFESQSFAEKILETYLEPNDFHCETVSTKSPGLFMEIIEKCAIEMAFFAFDAKQEELLLDLLERSRKERSRLKRVLFLEKEELGQVQAKMEELIDEFIVLNIDIQEFAIRFRKLHRDALLERNMISQEELKELLSTLDEEVLEEEEVPEDPEALAWETTDAAEEAVDVAEEALEASSTWEEPLLEAAPVAPPVEEDIWSWDVDSEEEAQEEQEILEQEILEADVLAEPEEAAELIEEVEEPVAEADAWAEPSMEDAPADAEEALEEAPVLSTDAEAQEELDRMLKKLLEDEAVLEKVAEEEAQALHKEKATTAARGVVPQPAEWYLRSAGHGGATIYEAEEETPSTEKANASLYSVKAPESKGEQAAAQGEKSRASYEEDIRVTIMGLNEKKKKSLLKKVVGGVIGAIGVGGLVYTFMLQIGF